MTKITKNHLKFQNSLKITKNHQNTPKPKIHFMSGNVTSISVDENSEHRNNSCQILRNHAWGHSGASGGVWGGVHAPRFRHVIFKNPKINKKQRRARTTENQGTPRSVFCTRM